MLEVNVQHQLGRFALDARFASDNRVTVFFGRSGSGKSTLVNIIAGLITPNRGYVRVDGETLFDSEHDINVPPSKRRIGYVFQEGRLFPHLTVRQNLAYGRFFAAPAKRYLEFDKIVELLGLSPLLDRRPGWLSGGEKQRVAIGRALLSSPRVLLLDEPLASLDSQHKQEILQYIEQLRDEFKIPIVYVSHAVEEVVRLADTTVILADGQVVASGVARDVMSRLDLRPVIGSSEAGAVIETKIAAYDEVYDLATLRFDGGELLVPNLKGPIGETVRLQVRAHDVSLSLQHPGRTSVLNVLRGQVSEVANTDKPVVDVCVRVGQTHLVAHVTRRSLDQLGIQVGQEIYALVKAVSLNLG